MSATLPDLQLSFDDLGTPLHEVTFCVLDLETTGLSPRKGARITEVGAVKVQGGQVIGTLATLVNPQAPVPATITALTGITDRMLVDAPTISAVLPSLIAFCTGTVLVAHNAAFDLRFLRAAATELGYDWPRLQHVDTVKLAQKLLLPQEVPNFKLTTLARHFGAATPPTHRALDDAQATVDVLHGLFERLGSLGITTWTELREFVSHGPNPHRARRHLADQLPQGPGVYLFRDRNDDVLYVGTSTNLYRRVRSYYTSPPVRRRITEMVRLAQRVEGIRCATALEGHIRELRLIHAHKPPYNRRSRHQERQYWLKLTQEHWPRLSIVRSVRSDGADYLGPVSSRRQAELLQAALWEAFPIRQCTQKLPRHPVGNDCVLGQIGRCLSPYHPNTTPAAYTKVTDQIRTVFGGDVAEVVNALWAAMERASATQRFEEASRARDRLSEFLRIMDTLQRISALRKCPEIVAARPHLDHVELHVIRFGRLAGATTLDLHADQCDIATAVSSIGGGSLLPLAEHVSEAEPTAASNEETAALLRWLTHPQTRLISVKGQWSLPVAGAARYWQLRSRLDSAVELQSYPHQ